MMQHAFMYRNETNDTTIRNPACLGKAGAIQCTCNSQAQAIGPVLP